VSKYTAAERALVKNIVATLSIKRIPEVEIINAIFDQTNKTLSKSGLFRATYCSSLSKKQLYDLANL
jgi:hypothetical protein